MTSIRRWTVADPARMSVVPAQEGDLVTYSDHVAAIAALNAENAAETAQYVNIYVDAWDGMAVPYDDHLTAVEVAHAAGMRGALADFLTSNTEAPYPPFRFSRSVECIHQFKTFDQIDGGKHAKCVLCGFKEPATQTSLSGPAAVLSSEPEPPTSVAPAGEDYGAHVKPIYVDAWDGMAVPYNDHVVAVEAAHAAGMREALADFLTSIDEDDPVYLRGHSVGIRDGIETGRVMAAHDVEQLGVWAVNPDAFIRLTDGMRLVRLNDAVKAARGEVDA